MRLIFQTVILLSLFAVLVIITALSIMTAYKTFDRKFQNFEKVANVTNNFTVGFCFLLGNEVTQPQVWQKCFDWLKAKGIELQIWIHEKERTDNSYFTGARKIDVIETRWGHISLVRACAHLMFAAFESGCDQVYFVSGDTIPILCNIETFLTNHSSCFQCSTVVNRRDRSRYHLNQLFPKPQKQNMFFASTKQDFVSVFPNKTVFEKELIKISSVFASDEWFFINHYEKNDCDILKLNNYIFVNPANINETQAVSWSQTQLSQNQSKISNFLFLRKVAASVTLPDFLTDFTLEN